MIAINHEVRGSFQSPVPSYDLRPREGVVILRRLTIVVDESNEKGFGLVSRELNCLPEAKQDIPDGLQCSLICFL